MAVVVVSAACTTWPVADRCQEDRIFRTSPSDSVADAERRSSHESPGVRLPPLSGNRYLCCLGSHDLSLMEMENLGRRDSFDSTMRRMRIE
jgi:hypothetical protein